MGSLNLNALIQGAAGPTLEVFKGAEIVEEIVVLDADGAPVDLTGGTVALEVHTGKTRTDTPEATFAATLTAATAGHATLTILSAAMTLTVGTHYAWVKYTESGGEIRFGTAMITLTVK